MSRFLIILVLSFLLSGIFSVLNFFLAPVSYNVEKTAIYEATVKDAFDTAQAMHCHREKNSSRY